MKRSSKITLTIIAWMLLYFLLLWRLPYLYQISRIKLPEGCKYVNSTISRTDAFWNHVITWALIESDNDSGEDVWDKIQMLNKEFEGRFGGFDVSDEPVMFRDISNPESFADYESGPLDRLTYMAKDDSKHYYVLKYFKEVKQGNVTVVFAIGIISTALAGITAGFLTRRSVKKAGGADCLEEW